MLIRRRPSWEMPERLATAESAFWSRRAVLAGIGAGVAAGAGLMPPAVAQGQFAPQTGDAITHPFPRNPAYALDREVTREQVATTYNNFYEFGSTKNIHAAAQKLTIAPWQVKIDGLVEKELTLDAADLERMLPREERLYRFRCVEAWAMAVPWSGYPLAKLVELARPLGSAKYLQMQTFSRAAEAPGMRQFWYPWPYTEGLTIAEATSELPMIVTGAYGKPLPKQMGAPLRLIVPWKYGFKSVKSIVRFTFQEQRPKTFWEALQSSEYGFWANVNPEVAHPRWSQASERLIDTDQRVPTQLFNGYAEQVHHLYKGLGRERLWA